MAILQHKPNRPEDAVEKLAPMVYKMAHKFARNHKANDFDDLVQEGFEGLMKAYHRFDASAGCAFSSYAYQWIFAHMNGDRRVAYKNYNNTSAKTIDDVAMTHSYELPVEALVDAKAMVARMDPTVRAIHRARQEGYTYAAIADAMTKLGKPCTLHQVRRQHLAALEA